uniref:Putative ovule protein n=1 Tax=Solanum chacoense TaxID=4108 RepID=A0A0V0GUG2_SOLCH
MKKKMIYILSRILALVTPADANNLLLSKAVKITPLRVRQVKNHTFLGTLDNQTALQRTYRNSPSPTTKYREYQLLLLAYGVGLTIFATWSSPSRGCPS